MKNKAAISYAVGLGLVILAFSLSRILSPGLAVYSSDESAPPSASSSAADTSWNPQGRTLIQPHGGQEHVNPGALTKSVSLSDVLPGVHDVNQDWRKFTPKVLTVAFAPGLKMEFERIEVGEKAERTLWTGRNGIPGAFMTSTATEQTYYATVAIPGAATYSISIDGGEVLLSEILHASETCAPKVPVPPIYAPPPRSALAIDALAPSLQESTPPTAVHDAATPVIDVFFFYDTAALSEAGNNVETIRTRVINDIQSANQILTNSNVHTFRWQYSALQPVPVYGSTAD